jgi:hypothetical protein
MDDERPEAVLLWLCVSWLVLAVAMTWVCLR